MSIFEPVRREIRAVIEDLRKLNPSSKPERMFALVTRLEAADDMLAGNFAITAPPEPEPKKRVTRRMRASSGVADSGNVFRVDFRAKKRVP